MKKTRPPLKSSAVSADQVGDMTTFRFDALQFPTFAAAEAAHRAASRAARRTGGAYPGLIEEVDADGRVWALTEYGRRVDSVRWEVWFSVAASK